VIKVVWGRHWDALLARDKDGILMRRMMDCVDGEYQTFKSKDGAYVREHFFNMRDQLPRLADSADIDHEIKRLVMIVERCAVGIALIKQREFRFRREPASRL
jgi:pyruvate dehydrogenase complex dehydrogenase (E1) component